MNMLALKHKEIPIVFALLMAVSLSGCLAFLPIAAGVATGYVAFKDSAAGNLDTTFDDLWSASLDTLERMTDVIILEDEDAGIIKAEQGANDITVKIIEFTPNAFKLKVTARRQYALANLELAQNIFTRIVRQVPPLKIND